MPALLILLAATISGTAALVAEVGWFRALGRGVGTSAEALAVVTAGFLGGLGIGAAIASRIAPRARAALRAAAICECAAGVLVFLSPFALAVVPDVHLAFHLEPGPSSWPAALVALPVLVLPTAFLGATLPFLVRDRLAGTDRAGRWTGLLYGVNTIGAAAGAALAVFVLLPRLGETSALRAAGAGNVLAALMFLLADRPRGLGAPAVPAVPTVSAVPEVPAAPGGEDRRTARAAGVALFASGALALGGEVAWFRLLDPVTGVHLFGLVFLLVPVLLGTAFGGLLGGWIADRVRRPDLALAVTVGFGGLLTLASVAVAGAVPFLVVANLGTYAGEGPTYPDLATEEVCLRALGAAACVVPPLMAFACAYPLAVKARASSVAAAARAAGAVYAWNTAGNVTGSLAAGFLLLPVVGGPRTLAVLGGVGLCLAGALWLAARKPRPAPAALAFLLPLLPLLLPGAGAAVERAGPALPEVVALSNWSPRLGRIRSREDMRVFSELYGGTYPTPPWRPDAGPVLPREGRIGSVGLLRERRWVKLRQGGLSESIFNATDPDAGSETEVSLALIPLLAHPAPKTAFVIGHGAGWTVETFLASEAERVDVAEIEPAVLDLVEEYRGPLAVRTNPKARLLVTDGRLVLREAAAEGGRYDVIASQPSHPWVPGAGHLFTVEAYRLARRALAPGGVFAQWLNIFDTTGETFQTALAGWREVFPDSWLFHFKDEVVLVGFTAPPRIDAARWERALAEGPLSVRTRAAGIRGPEDLLKRFALDGAGIERLVPRGTVPTTDDDPRLEWGLAWLRMVGGADASQANASVRAQFPPDLVKVIPDAAARARWTVRAVDRILDDGRTEDARRWLEKVPFDGGVAGKRVRAREARKSKQPQRAEDFLRLAIREAPDDPRPVEDLLDLLLDLGRSRDAAEAARPAAEAFPGNGRILHAFAKALVGLEERERAAEAFARALAAKDPPAPAGAGHQYARLLLSFSPPRSKEAHEALRADASTYSDPEALGELAHLEIDVGDEDERKRLEALLEAVTRERGRERIGWALAAIYDAKPGALDNAREGTDLAPDDVEGWRLRGVLELRAGLSDAAQESFARAAETAAAAGRDPEAERRRARAWTRMLAPPAASGEGAAP